MANLVQINRDGSTSIDVDPPAVSYPDQVTIIKAALAQEGWTINRYDEDQAGKRHLIEIEKSGEVINAILYIFSPFNYSQPRTNLSEKRIQLGTPTGANKVQRDQDFALPPSGSPRCALLGIYKRDDLVLFGAWDSAHYVDHKTNPNLWMKGEPLLAAAARVGLARDLNTHGHILCAFVPSMLPAYLRDMALLHTQLAAKDPLIKNEVDEVDENPVDADLPHNRIFYGAPGTGKSYTLNTEVEKFFPENFLFERTTFFPDYTSGMFIGSYRPSPIYREVEGVFYEADQKTSARSLEPIIDYRYVPGPFLRLLARALKYPAHNFCLLIEEINRANASAVFADAFQMLDRNKDGSGKYKVTLPVEAQEYLAMHGHTGPVGLPSNMYIWATMNSVDQNVFTLDSAFKRRWSMEYIGLDDGEYIVKDWEISLKFLPEPIKWNAFRKAINQHLAREGVAEDRLLGPFFVTEKDLTKPKAFEEKVIHYLRDDVMRTSPGKLFVGESKSFGSLVNAYRRDENIFVEDINFGGS